MRRGSQGRSLRFEGADIDRAAPDTRPAGQVGAVARAQVGVIAGIDERRTGLQAKIAGSGINKKRVDAGDDAGAAGDVRGKSGTVQRIEVGIGDIGFVF